MKICVISDTHGQHELLELPPADVIIHSGDFSATGSHKDHYNFSKWFGSLPYKHKLVTPGNHDRYSAEQTAISKQLFKDHGCELLIDQQYEIDGKKFYLAPWTPRYGRWYWMRDRGDSIKKLWDIIPEGLDVLVTHGPPWGILDYSVYDHVHCGCEELMRAIVDKKPKFHVFGHIHFYGGMQETIGDTTYVNAALCNEEYKPVNKIQVIEL